MAEFNPAILQAALLEGAEATKAAALVAQTAQQAAQQQQQFQQPATSSTAATGTSSTSIDWSKLINKPPLLEGKTVEDEIRAFRDWSWQLVQYLNAIDTNHETEVQSILDDPTKPLDVYSFSGHTSTRCTSLWSSCFSLQEQKPQRCEECETG